MADNEGEETASHGNEWEVVSLTASTYAAAPGPKGFESNDDDDKGNEFIQDDEETSRAMFMSGHFVLPPNQPENPPLEPDNSKIDNEPMGEDMGSNEVPRLEVEEVGESYEKNEENWNIKGLTIPDKLPGIQFLDEKGNRLSIRATDFEASTAFQGLNLVDKDQSIYTAAKFNSSYMEADISGSTVCDNAPSDPMHQRLDSPSDLSKLLNCTKEVNYNGSSLPCQAWWKRRTSSLYARAKEANTFWSIFVAAALMGLVIIGRRWPQEKWQVQLLKWQFSINDEKTNRMLGPITRLKFVVVDGQQRGSAIGAAEH